MHAWIEPRKNRQSGASASMDVEALSRLESSVGLGAEEEKQGQGGDDGGPVFDAHNKRPGIEADLEDEEEENDPIVAALPSRGGECGWVFEYEECMDGLDGHIDRSID